MPCVIFISKHLFRNDLKSKNACIKSNSLTRKKQIQIAEYDNIFHVICQVNWDFEIATTAGLGGASGFLLGQLEPIGT